MQASDPTTPPRILLVEDDTISQTYFRAVLEALPARVEVAASCACALERAQDAGYELWLIDLTLPDGPGLELLPRLRDRCPQPPPALAHTADNDPARTPRCEACQGRAGTHPCGCWAPEDRQPVCGHCNAPERGHTVPWPCPTVQAIGGESSE